MTNPDTVTDLQSGIKRAREQQALRAFLRGMLVLVVLLTLGILIYPSIFNKEQLALKRADIFTALENADVKAAAMKTVVGDRDVRHIVDATPTRECVFLKISGNAPFILRYSRITVEKTRVGLYVTCGSNGPMLPLAGLLR